MTFKIITLFLCADGWRRKRINVEIPVRRPSPMARKAGGYSKMGKEKSENMVLRISLGVLA